MQNRHFRIGILGGMGPMAGVLLQKLIIEATPATRDQDHIQVVCFTDPKIPDRTESLAVRGGKDYIQAIVESLEVLKNTSVDVVIIPCNTAHSRLEDIKKASGLNFLNMVQLCTDELKVQGFRKPGLLATTGTIAEGVYTKELGLDWILPDAAAQAEVMDIIYQIKRGVVSGVGQKILSHVNSLFERGADSVILGCTELSLYYEVLSEKNEKIFDPLRIVAQEAVKMSRQG